MQKYRYSQYVVEVEKTGTVGNRGKFNCLVRGFGHGNTAPKKRYYIEAISAAQATRIAFEMYTKSC